MDTQPSPKLKGSEADWCACPLSPYLFSGRARKSPGREQNAQQIGVNRLATSILNARFIVWRQTPARYNWPLIRVRQKVNSSLGRASSLTPSSRTTFHRAPMPFSRPFLVHDQQIGVSSLLAVVPAAFHLRVCAMA